MKRLFYFTGYRLKVFHWKNRTLVGEFSFEPTDTGLARFRQYLQQSVNIPARFLVDVIEEDFRIETVPHVGNRDRNAVIHRLIDRYYRSSQQYCYHEVIGREKSGRKDDRVLIGAMTNPMLIQPWLSIIDECEVPLAGIWSLPLVSHHLLKKINAHKGATLLVSQQVNSNVRQSLFRDGKLLSSRQSIINQDIRDSNRIGEYAAPEVEKTLAFLRNQELLTSSESVNLHIIGNDQQIDSLRTSFISDESQRVYIHSTRALIESYRLKNTTGSYADEIFSWLCNSQTWGISHYGDYSQFSRYISAMASVALYVASIVILVTGFLLTEANISEAIGYKESAQLLNREEQQYRQIYTAKFRQYEGVFNNAGVMNAAVDLADTIKHNSQTSPLDFMLQLSHILADKTLPEIEIDRIQWRAINTGEENTAKAGAGKHTRTNFTSKNEVVHQALIKGRISAAENNYRESVLQVNAILHALESSPAVIAVKAVSVPVDLRQDSKFSTESGLESTNNKKPELSGVFKINITMHASAHE